MGCYREKDSLTFGFIIKKQAIAQIPPNHIVYTVNEVKYHTIAIGGSEIATSNHISSFPIEQYHYYCETYDLTRPFPSDHEPFDFDPSFCWNIEWRKPFIKAPNSCIVLIQGFCSSKKKDIIIKRPTKSPSLMYLPQELKDDDDD